MKNIILAFTLSIGFVCLAPRSLAAEIEAFNWVTPRVETVKGFIHFAIGVGKEKTPVMVLAPGRGYHMGLPLTQGIAEKLAANGISAVRFDWAYFSNGKKPSKGLVNELEDYTTVVNTLKKDLRFDSSEFLIAGKSLGSVVSYRFFDQNQEAKALFLLTPICVNWFDDKGAELPEPRPGGALNYQTLPQSSRTVVSVLGHADPDNCPLPFWYEFLKDSKGNVATVVLGGDHSLNVGDEKEIRFQELNRQNLEAAQEVVVQWARLLTQKPN